MSRSTPNHSEDTQGYIAELCADRLTLPEPYLYKLLLEEQNLEDTAERRRQFKRLLVTRQMEEGMMPPQVDQKELSDFMNPEDSELRLERSQNLMTLLEWHLEETQDFAEAQRLAVLELFHQEAPLRQGKTDKAHFRNPELVRADLTSLAAAFLAKTGKPIIKLHDLNTTNINVNFTLVTGERVHGTTYLKRAAIALGKAKDHQEAQRLQRETLALLKQTAGFEVVAHTILDRAYFMDPVRVKTDLIALAIAASKSVGKVVRPQDLGAGRHIQASFTVSTGEYINGQTYLRRAAIAFEKAENHKEAGKIQGKILNDLKQIAGFDVVEHVHLDEAYFNDPVKVGADLKAIAISASEKAGNTILPKDLNTNHIKVYFTLTTGESVKGTTYVSRAAIVMGRAEHTRGAQNKHKEVLKYLKRIAGFEVIEYPPLDAAYFSDSIKVRADFVALAEAASEKAGKAIHPRDLALGRPTGALFSMSTGEFLSGRVYLSRAVIALGMAENSKEAQKVKKEVLIFLKKIAGFEVVEYPPLDAAYFSDSIKVRADLVALAEAVSVNKGKVIHPTNLSLSRRIQVSFTVSNGQSMNGRTYLNRAAKAFGKAKTNVEAGKRGKETLALLKQTAGFTTE